MFEKNHVDDSPSNIVRRLLERSVLFRLLSSASDAITEASSEARTVQFAHTIEVALSDILIQSYLYRWLTAEPDPEVIVIDLRETWTVAPVLWLLTAVVEWLYTYWRNSNLRRVGSEFQSIGNYLVDSRVVTVLVKALVPPQAPETNTEENHEKE